MSRATDLEHCVEILHRGSKSFHAASLLLPARTRGEFAAVYAFCRVADDAVDLDASPVAPVARLRERLDAVYGGAPSDDPVDRALAATVAARSLPREPFDYLLEGFEWDLARRTYETPSDVVAYAVRVASSVGVMLTVLVGDRRRRVLERACDLGIAMQLTNIARDVGEDARAGRLYLPAVWLREAGVDATELLSRPRFSPAVGLVTRRVLDLAERHYRRADLGIRMLPRGVRVAIDAARHIYAEIGRDIERAGYDSVTRRAGASAARKAWLAVRSMPIGLPSARAPVDLPPTSEAAGLVAAVADDRA